MNLTAYQNAQRLPEMDLKDVSKALQNPDILVWLAVKDPTKSQLKSIQKQFELHELAIEDASHAHQRPKLESYGDTLFVAVHTVRTKGDDTTQGQLHAFIGRNFVILIQHGGTTRYDRVQSRCENSPELFMNGPGFVLYAVLDLLVDQFIVVAQHLQTRLDELENIIFSTQLDAPHIETIYGLKREVHRLHNVTSPIAGICGELFRHHPEIVTKTLMPYFRDVEDHVERVMRTTGMLQEALSDAMQVNLALVTIRQNEVVKKLAGWGAILGIPATIFTMYGMNFKFMPEYEWILGYPATLAVTYFICREVYRRLCKAGWL